MGARFNPERVEIDSIAVPGENYEECLMQLVKGLLSLLEIEEAKNDDRPDVREAVESGHGQEVA